MMSFEQVRLLHIKYRIAPGNHLEKSLVCAASWRFITRHAWFSKNLLVISPSIKQRYQTRGESMTTSHSSLTFKSPSLPLENSLVLLKIPTFIGTLSRCKAGLSRGSHQILRVVPITPCHIIVKLPSEAVTTDNSNRPCWVKPKRTECQNSVSPQTAYLKRPFQMMNVGETRR